MPADSVPPEKMTLSFSIENLMDSVSTDQCFLFIKIITFMNSPMFFTIDLIISIVTPGETKKRSFKRWDFSQRIYDPANIQTAQQ